MKPALRSSNTRAGSDSEIIARLVAGELDALGVLFDRYEHDVRRLLARIGVAPGDLDDLVQQTFLEVPRASHAYDGRLSARPWLLGIAVTMARRHRRSFARMTARLRALAVALHVPRPDTPADSLEGHEAEARVARALASLSPSKREAFVLVTLEGATGEEAAALLGVPVNTVWTRLHHARKELRARLGKDSP